MKTSISAVLAVALLAGAAFGQYQADKYVPLPLEPNPLYPDATNWDSGNLYLIDQYPEPYVVILENELNYNNWKEWILDLYITPDNPNDWGLEVHVDYSFRANPGEEPPLYQQINYWDVLITGSDYNPVSEWTVVGAPGNIPPLKIDPQAPDVDYYCDMEIPPFGEPYEFFDYNPEFISLEFTTMGSSGVTVSYDLVDWCIPEPASLSVLALAATVLLRRR